MTSTIGQAILDTALVAYPLYQTSKYIVVVSSDADEDNVDRLMRFWLVYGNITLLQQLGFSEIPGFYLFKIALMISMYSDVHSLVVNDIILKSASQQYITLAERAIQWWNKTAVPKVEASGLFTYISNYFVGTRSK